MKIPSTVMRGRLAEAVLLRASGHHWAAIAAKLGRSVNTCMNWPCIYRGAWDELYHDAENGFLNELTAEARRTLQAQLRLDNVRDRREAARLLLAHVDRNQLRTSRPNGPTAHGHVEGLNNEQLRDLESATDDTLGTGTAGGAREAGGAAQPG
jgi:hypothetical protein